MTRSAFFLLLLVACSSAAVQEVTIGGVMVNAELAVTPEQHARGLMFRESLASDAGMLFVFSKAQRISFWMKNTKIPLDMIFLDENKTVVQIVTASPCIQDFCPNYGGAIAQYVLEVNAGFAKENGVLLGSSVVFDIT